MVLEMWRDGADVGDWQLKVKEDKELLLGAGGLIWGLGIANCYVERSVRNRGTSIVGM